jgi:hypothetical protein
MVKKPKRFQRLFVKSFAESSILFEFKEGSNFNHPRGIGLAFHGAGRNILNISN